jgi:hypothetical protein
MQVDAYAARIAGGRHVTRVSMRIVPLLHGSWAVEQFGSAPVRVDALRFRTAQVTALKARIDEERHKHQSPEVQAAAATGQPQGTSSDPSKADMQHDIKSQQQQAGASKANSQGQGDSTHVTLHVNEEGKVSIGVPPQQAGHEAQGASTTTTTTTTTASRPNPHVSALEDGARAPPGVTITLHPPAPPGAHAHVGGGLQQPARQAAAEVAAVQGVAATAGSVTAGGEMSEEAACRAAAAQYLPTAFATFKTRWAAAVAAMA